MAEQEKNPPPEVLSVLPPINTRINPSDLPRGWVLSPHSNKRFASMTLMAGKGKAFTQVTRDSVNGWTETVFDENGRESTYRDSLGRWDKKTYFQDGALATNATGHDGSPPWLNRDFSRAQRLLEALNNTDWTALRLMKADLIGLVDSPLTQNPALIEGLINFLDAIQDAVVDDQIASEKEVFNFNDIDHNLMLVLPVTEHETDHDAPEECRVYLSEHEIARLIEASFLARNEGIDAILISDTKADFCDADDTGMVDALCSFKVFPARDVDGEDTACIYVMGSTDSIDEYEAGPIQIPTKYLNDPSGSMHYLCAKYEHELLSDNSETFSPKG